MDDERLHAVLIEPQLARFREVCGLQGEGLEIRFSGWHRHAILSHDRVFLFPRHRQWVAGLQREAALLGALNDRSPVVPRLLGAWQDDGISPYPFIATSRIPGTVWGALEADVSFDQVATMVTSLGRAIAGWHSIELRDLPPRFRRRGPGPRGFDVSLAEDALRPQAERAVKLLDAPGKTVETWLNDLAPLRKLKPVLVHGDVHEDQILVDAEMQVTGVFDWETASAGNPVKDFDFGEWGFNIFRWEAEFPVLRRAMWDAYAAARGIELPSWQVMHLFYCLRDLPPDDAAGEWTATRRNRILDALRDFTADP